MGDNRRRGYLPEDSSTSSSAEKGKLENKKAKDSEALYYIQTAVADHIFPRISVATSAKEAWSILQKEYQGSAKVRIIKLQTLRRDFENMKMKDSETIDEYYTKVRELVNQLKAYGEDIPEKRLKGNYQANCIEENNSSDQLFYTCNSVAETGEATWYIDSAASNHMTYNKGAFQTLDESFKTNVKLGDNHIVKVEGKGSVAINTKKGTTHGTKQFGSSFYTDVCGPMRTPSHEQNRYFILFIDDYSRMTWVYFMREKSEVFKVFKKFKNLVEKQSGRSIKVLRSDRGKEYNNSEFNKFCEEEGIEHQTTVSYNPQQNGVSERKNRTVMEMARSMLQEKHLPKAFWAEAVYTAVYLLNRCPTKAVQNMTPIEAWSGKKPSAKHLRVFGSICYVHIPTEKRHKLEEKTEKGIFLGYSTQSKGYRIYNLKTKKLIISRDVEFDEDAMWNWDKEKVERQSVMIPKETPPQQQQEEGTDQAEMERRSQQAPGSPRRPPPSEEIEEETPPRRTKLLSDIYETCNFIMLEPENFETAVNIKPKNKEVIGVKWIYKTKLNADGSIQKHKARLVAKGYSQLPGIDYTETFAPVARLDTIRALIAIAANKKWKIYQMDVKSAFLNGYIDEEIYVEQPQGFIAKGSEEKVLRLKKALYGLKQAPRAWYSRIDKYFMIEDFGGA
ncbi:UNVERIFIED_CONTAM: Retrovirus-related Pol polyprotein from transposon TNT 1-94 [Sesamum radiatum]|uniref:Retrovirus-related Pol polyprotein from transposon TNT 1-94 n=1 Tax=Sesamum radiatum TaxID=300843 RepID=A0AAW2V979_SESRA